MRRAWMVLGSCSLLAVGGCVTAEVLADVTAVVDVVNLIVGWLPALV